MKNLFITLEGIEGVGKSSAIAFIKHYFFDKKIDALFTREPGGTPIGESIREILLHHKKETILPETELLLLFAARVQHIQHVIKPALKSGKTVVSDRFTDASFAYQGGGRGVSKNILEILEKFVQENLQPDLTLLLDAPVEVGLSRVQVRGEKDRIENESHSFFERVRQAYLNLAKQHPNRFAIIDASKSEKEVQAQIAAALDKIVMRSNTL